VSSSVYTADKGGSAGAQISVVTKSGTNAFHGGVFEFLRNGQSRRTIRRSMARPSRHFV